MVSADGKDFWETGAGGGGVGAGGEVLGEGVCPLPSRGKRMGPARLRIRAALNSNRKVIT